MTSANIKRNTLLNLGGSIVPMLVSLITVPLYLQYIGLARYGVMSIVWILLGYFGVFDLGLSRATTNQIARTNGASAEDREAVFWTALWLNGLFGLLGAAALYLAAWPLLAHVFKMPEFLRWEILGVLPWIAALVPLATMSGVLSGSLEGSNRFVAANSLQVMDATLFQAVPLVAAMFLGPQLSVIIPAAVLARITSTVSLAIAALRIFSPDRIRFPQKNWARKLVSYGIWVCVTSFLSPLLVNLDQIAIGSILGVNAVAYYSVPFNVAGKIQVLPFALARAMFPRLSAQTPGDAKELATRATRFVGIAMTAVIAPAILLIGPFLKWWVGADFANNATLVAQIILFGVWINGPSFVPFALLQAHGRPDFIAKFQLMELVPLAGLIWVAVGNWGLTGAALICCARISFDTGMLFWGSRIGLASLGELLPGATLVGLTWFVAAVVQPSPMLGVLIAAGTVSATAAWGWRVEPEIPRMVNEWCMRYSFKLPPS